MLRKKKTETDSHKPRAVEKAGRAPKVRKAKSDLPANGSQKTRTSKTPKSKAALLPTAAPVPGNKLEAREREKDGAWKKPHRQGETRLMAFVRDPYCLFTYWEVTPQSVEEIRKQLGGEYPGSVRVLRVFKAGSDGREELVEEIRVEPDEMNRYIEVKETGGGYFVEIAQKTQGGRVVAYARSNRIWTSPSPQAFEPAGKDAAWEAPAGLVEYFSETAGPEFFPVPKNISSAESHLRKRNRYFSSPMG